MLNAIKERTTPKRARLNQFLRYRSIEFLILIWTMGCLLALAYGLAELPPYHTDESYYVESVRTMVETGDYLTPYYHGKERFSKPILIYWLMAAAEKWRGPGLETARIWSALLGSLCIPFTFFLGRRMFDSQTALFAAWILPTCFLHFSNARWATTDMTLTFFTLSAFYYFYKGTQNSDSKFKYYRIFYFYIGLGFLVKGPAGLMPILVILVFFTFSRQLNELRDLRLDYGICMIAAVNLPWFGAMVLMHGEVFTGHILTIEVEGRLFPNTGFSAYFFEALLRYHLPWSLFLLPALCVLVGWTRFPSISNCGKGSKIEDFPCGLRKWFKPESRSMLFCILAVTLPTLVFSLLRAEHSRYLLPTTPFVALIIGRFLSRLGQSPEGFGRVLFKWPFLIILVFYGGLALVAGATVMIYHEIHPIPFRMGFLPFALVFGVSSLVLLFFYKKVFPLIGVMALVHLIVLTLVSGDLLPFFNRYPTKQFSEVIQRDAINRQPIVTYRLGTDRSKLEILTGFPVYEFEDIYKLKSFVEENHPAYAIIREEDWKETLAGKPYQLVAKEDRWKSKWLNRESFEAVWDRGVRQTLPDYLETVLLFKRENSGIKVVD